MEIIPAIDIIDGRCVRLTKGDYAARTEYRDRPVDMVKRYLDYGFSRIHAVDLDGAKAGTPKNLRTLEQMAYAGDSKIEWGGGIKTDQDITDCLNAGAQYCVIGSVAAKQPEIFTHWLSKYGTDRIILGADAKDGKIAVAGWTDTTDLTIVQLISKFLPNLTQVIVTDISKDGMLEGPAFALYDELRTSFPEIAFTVSGGISSIADIERLYESGTVRVIVGKAIYEGRISLEDLSRINQI